MYEVLRQLSTIVVPIKTMSYYREHLHRSETIFADGVYRIWRMINTILCYMFALFVAQHLLDSYPNGDRDFLHAILADIIYLIFPANREIRLHCLLMTSLALYYNYRTYRGIDRRFVRAAPNILFDSNRYFEFRETDFLSQSISRRLSEAMRYVSLAIVNVLQLFTLFADTLIVFVLFPLVGRFAYVQFWQPATTDTRILVFPLRLACSFACVTNACALALTILLFSHLCILQASFAMSCLYALYACIERNHRRLNRDARLRPITIERFARTNVRTIEALRIANHRFADIFLTFMLVNTPMSAYLINLIIFSRGLITRMLIAIFVAHQVLVIFGVHCCITQITTRLHRCGRTLAKLFVRTFVVTETVKTRRCVRKWTKLERFVRVASVANVRNRSHRVCLRVALLIDRLHVRRQYGFMYGRLGLVTMIMFFKCLMIYTKLFIFSYKIFRTSIC